VPIKCTIKWDTQAQAYLVTMAFNKDFVGALKSLIPSGDRQYDDNSKTWFVKESYGLMIQNLAQNAFGTASVSFVSKQVAEQAASQSGASSGSPNRGSQGALINASVGTTEDAIVAFFSLLSYSAARKAYLFGLSELHPDKPTGDREKAAKMNTLWDRIEREYFKR
jgi:hypothetical protein